MRKYKIILLTIFYILFIKYSFAQENHTEMMSKLINERADSNVIREVCEHKYSHKEIQRLEKSANKGDNNAQLKLGIIYDIKALQLYWQVRQKNENFDLATKFSLRESPCDYINNTTKN